MSKIKGWVPKAFKDSGTQQRFEGDQHHEFEPGAYANYVAAGKVLKDKPTKAEKADNAPAPAGGKAA